MSETVARNKPRTLGDIEAGKFLMTLGDDLLLTQMSGTRRTVPQIRPDQYRAPLFETVRETP